MRLEYIKKRLKDIDSIKGDPERAHSLEDRLYREFIQHVARRKDKIGLLAQAVLASKGINFPRWCA